MYTEHLMIPVGPGRLHVARTGRGGPAVVLLHDFGASSFQWRAVAPALANRGVTVVAVDLLGFGESDRPIGTATGPGAQAEYLERALTALRLSAVQVIGHGLGALVALLLAAEHPHRVLRTGLLDPLPPDDLPGPAIRAMQRASGRAALTANSLFGARPLLEVLLADGLPENHPEADRLLARTLAPFVGRNGMADLLQLAAAVTLSPGERERLGQITGPVHCWLGHGDGARPGAAPEAWAGILPSATVTAGETGQPVGAWVGESAPAAVTAAILAWLTYPE
ncbi:MAG: alpha/beta hydrolase [Gemmatimonadaceae bacterium]|nr:alpha/beta hydrolase [Gemmatimonadaceae bacterium]